MWMASGPWRGPWRFLRAAADMQVQRHEYDKTVSELSALNGLCFDEAFSTLGNLASADSRKRNGMKLTMSVFRQLVWQVTSLLEEQVQKLLGIVYQLNRPRAERRLRKWCRRVVRGFLGGLGKRNIAPIVCPSSQRAAFISIAFGFFYSE